MLFLNTDSSGSKVYDSRKQSLFVCDFFARRVEEHPRIDGVLIRNLSRLVHKTLDVLFVSGVFAGAHQTYVRKNGHDFIVSLRFEFHGRSHLEGAPSVLVLQNRLVCLRNTIVGVHALGCGFVHLALLVFVVETLGVYVRFHVAIVVVERFRVQETVAVVRNVVHL